MTRKTLKDRYGKRIGEIVIKSDGMQELRDKYGKYLGKYDPKRDETRDRYGKLVGRGNLLSALLLEELEED